MNESILIAIILLIVYLTLFIFIKSYVKTYIPILLIGYLIKAYKIADLNLISKLFVYIACFLIAFNIGSKVEKSFFKKTNIEMWISDIIEKIIFILLFFVIFAIIAPKDFIPLHFIFFVSIINFIYSDLFVKIEKAKKHFNINNIIVFSVISVFYLFFKENEFTVHYNELIIFLITYFLVMFIFIKLKIESKIQILATFSLIIGLSIVTSLMIGIIPLTLGFALGIIFNFSTKTKNLIIKNFLNKTYQYYSIPLLFFSGYLLELSYKLIIISIIYIIIRIILRVVYYILSDNPKSFSNFISNNGFFLVQGEELLIFLSVYSIEFNFRAGLTVILTTLIFSELLINFLYSYTKKITG
ncbi:MAG TPA: hypothetical protein PKW55_04740 [Spirochaetota bacterium]|nr:hypothetical protein [Spirochaetota bacterium]HOM37854.1 hypothetical protein [Spirochaetota bacterium]HPQ48658.1 hypothetical protein [Spirochaetota bacterium]